MSEDRYEKMQAQAILDRGPKVEHRGEPGLTTLLENLTDEIDQIEMMMGRLEIIKEGLVGARVSPETANKTQGTLQRDRGLVGQLEGRLFRLGQISLRLRTALHELEGAV